VAVAPHTVVVVVVVVVAPDTAAADAAPHVVVHGVYLSYFS